MELSRLDDDALLRFASIFSGKLGNQIENVRYHVERATGMYDVMDLNAILRAQYLWTLQNSED